MADLIKRVGYKWKRSEGTGTCPVEGQLVLEVTCYLKDVWLGMFEGYAYNDAKQQLTYKKQLIYILNRSKQTLTFDGCVPPLKKSYSVNDIVEVKVVVDKGIFLPRGSDEKRIEIEPPR